VCSAFEFAVTALGQLWKIWRDNIEAAGTRKHNPPLYSATRSCWKPWRPTGDEARRIAANIAKL
jgi:hypothetical protein